MLGQGLVEENLDGHLHEASIQQSLYLLFVEAVLLHQCRVFSQLGGVYSRDEVQAASVMGKHQDLGQRSRELAGTLLEV